MPLKACYFLSILAFLCCSCSQKQQESTTDVAALQINKTEKKNLITNQGDTILTGVAIPAKGKKIKPDRVSIPNNIVLRGAPKVVPAHTNVHPIGKPKLIQIPRELTVITLGRNGEPLPKTLPAKGNIRPALYTQAIPATAPKMKNNAAANIQYLDVDQGLISSYIRSMLMDRYGNLWFGTLEGLSRYDGNSFTHFTTGENLSHNSVLSMLEDRKGNLWFGTEGGGLNRYDGNSFTHYSTEEGLSHNSISSMLEDSQGNLWFGTAGGGVNRYDPHQSKFIHYTTKEGLSNNVVNSMLEDSRGDLWFGTDKGLSRFNPAEENKGGTFIHYSTEEGLSHERVSSMLEDGQGNLWFGTFGGGINRYEPDGDRGSFSHYTTELGLSDNYIRSMLEDSQGNLWFGTYYGGVNKYDGNNMPANQASFTAYTVQEGLSFNRVRSIIEDSQGNLWFGTNGGGVNKYNGQSFVHYTTEQGMSHNRVRSIMEDSRGNILFGTAGGGVSHYDGHNFIQYSADKNLTDFWVETMLDDSQDNLWLGTNGGGVIRYDRKDLPVAHTGFTQYTTKQGLNDNVVVSMIEDSNGNIWFGTVEGLSRYDANNSPAEQAGFTQFTTESGLSHNRVRCILEDRKGNLWFGTFGGGVSRYEPNNDGGSFTHFTTNEGLSNNFVESILEDSQGNLWIGTKGGGVNQYDPDRDSFIQYTREQGLSSNWIWSILEDKKKNIWLSTQKGITVMRPLPADTSLGIDVTKADYQFITFGKKDGLKRIDFELNSACLDRNNHIWWGSFDGLTMLDLNQFKFPTDPPEIGLNTIVVGQIFIDYRRLGDTNYNNTFSFGKELSNSFDSIIAFSNYPVKLDLPYDINHLTFQFSAIDWAAPHKVKYSYRMEGLNENWSPLNSEPKADYRNLPYGTFTLKVKAIGAALVWSETFDYTFTIRPPWWFTWWAYSLYALFALSTIFGYVRWRTYALRKRQKVLEKTVRERTAEVVAKNDELATKNEIIIKEKDRSEALLLNILPSEIAEELKKHGSAKAKNYDIVTVLFTDFKGFTQHSERLSPEKLVAEIDHCFKAFDLIMEKFNVEKIKTIGDAYMAAAGLPTPNISNPIDAVKAALAVRDFMLQYKSELEAKGEEAFEIRIGIHSGPVVAGIVGIKKFAYDIWGDTVNLAARMESSGEVGRVNLNQSTYEHLKDHPAFKFISRGKVNAKNKGEIEMYFVENA